MRTFIYAVVLMLAIIGAGMYIYPINQEKPTITGRDDSMTTVNDRSSTSVQDQWKLEDLFANEQEWEQEYEIVQNKIKEINSCHGTLSDPLKVKSCFELEDDISIHTERLYVYANMRHHEDTTVSKYQALSDKATKLSVDVGQALSFITPEILSLPDETLKQFIDHPELKPYRRTLQEILRQKPHILSKAEEALLAQAGNMAQAPGTIFGMINNADMQFPKIENEKGELVELTHGNYIQFLESRDQEVRKRAFEAMYSTYKKQKNTIAATLSANLNKNIFYSKVRKFPSALEMSLFSDNISTEVYDNLISTIHEHLPLLHRYIALRKKMLNLDDMHMYDLFTPLVEEFDMDISYEEAQATVKESLTPLGERYLDILQMGFNERWIDVYENKGKRSGAYSWGAYGTHPYVLLNHKDNLNSMFTLTHEMGHALHSYLSDETQSYREAQYPIFLAEVASTLNEALLMDNLLNHTEDEKEKLYLLTYYADQFRTTVFRQTMFAEFEKMIHERAEKGQSLTPEDFSKIYYDLNVKYHGDGMIVDEDIAMEWARIPHFYSSFYVYKYATGFAAATSFSKQILDEGQPAVDRYLKFLQSGGSDYPLNILSEAGVDMSTPEPIAQAMAVFESVIEQMEQLTK